MASTEDSSARVRRMHHDEEHILRLSQLKIVSFIEYKLVVHIL